ncbi:hypothetical protein B0T44_23230 [Nocardia donostiensis]|uniref:Uncharacterized protein n=1 Tax=Nocardia donostiensis TaxID=1538463 RepID=A0A1W0B5F6_9NOCA|nr:hypothetical protein B0T46_25170 [Nocardia donostiensis]OQS17740.1 hypothetical protein B0T44_23230 [Nocardia donostiensis]
MVHPPIAGRAFSDRSLVGLAAIDPAAIWCGAPVRALHQMAAVASGRTTTHLHRHTSQIAID